MTIAPFAAQNQAAGATHVGPPALLLHPDLRLSPEQFALVCEANPEAVLELAADGQLISMTPNGAQLGWLLFPEQRAVEIWRPGAEPERLEEAEALEGGDVLPGLQLELEEIWTG
jgi:Uma2 family endonuclease